MIPSGYLCRFRRLRLCLTSPILILLSLCFPLHAQLDGIYVIGNSGEFTTVSEAVDTLNTVGVSGPVTFQIQPGTYNEQVIIRPIAGVDRSSSVRFVSQTGNPADVTITYSATGATDNYVIQLDSADYVTISNLTLQATGSEFSRIIVLNGPCRGDSIVGNTFVNMATISGADQRASIYKGFQINRGDSLVIDGNDVQDGAAAFSLNATNNSVITNNRITGSYSAITLDWHDGVIIDGNTIEAQSTGFSLTRTNNQIQITRNFVRLSNNANTGLRTNICTGSPALVANNFIVATQGMLLGLTSDFNIYHNTIYNSGSTSGYSIYSVTNTNSNLNIVNNIMYRASGGLAYRIQSSAAISQSDHNLIYSHSVESINWDGMDGSLSDFQLSTGLDQNSTDACLVLADSNLTNPGLAAKDAGVTLTGIIDDFDGDPRNDGLPDIGADEFNPPSGFESPMAGLFTVGTGGDFASLADARYALKYRGVSGAVDISILPATLSQRFEIDRINGTGAANPVTFGASTGNPNDVVFEYSNTSSDSNYVILIENTNHITVKNLSVYSVGSSFARGIVIGERAEAITVNNTIIDVGNDGSSDNVSGIYSASMDFAERTITNNIVTSSAFGIKIFASTTNAGQGTNLSITDNTVDGGFAGIWLTDTGMLQLLRNNVSDGTYSVYLQDITETFTISKNVIAGSVQYGLHLFNCSGSAERGLISNNFFTRHDGTSNGLQLRNCNAVDVVHNSVAGGTAFRVEGGSDINVLNNSFASDNSYAYYVTDPASVIQSDHNNLFTTGIYLAWWNGNASTLADLQTVSGFDGNSLSIDPVYASDTDLHTFSAALDSAAIPFLRVSDDIDDQIRDSVFPDIGADEFISGNLPPIVTNPISDVAYPEDSGPRTVVSDLNSVFQDPNQNDVLTFGGFSSSPEVTVLIQTNSLVLDFAENYFGFADITVTATDTANQSTSDVFRVTVAAVNDTPTVSGIADSISFQSGASYTLNIWNYAQDVETAVDQLSYGFSSQNNSLNFDYNANTGDVIITAATTGVIYMTATATDPEGASGAQSVAVIVSTVSSIDNPNSIPDKLALHNNYPNPFNPSTTIRFGLPEAAKVTLDVFDVTGRQVKVLYQGSLPPGSHDVEFDSGQLPSGPYFYRLRSANQILVKKMLLLK